MDPRRISAPPLTTRRGDLQTWLPDDSRGGSPTFPHSTNVYVRLLPRSTHDEDLIQLGSPFGTIVSVRSYPHNSRYDDEGNEMRGRSEEGGMGFIAFEKVEESERAIRGLNDMGFEASYARDSFSTQLQKLADVTSTNLYISNLPREYDEQDLVRLFSPLSVLSVRLLRHQQSDEEMTALGGRPSGASRGIGFARLEDRASAELALSRLENVRLPGSHLPLRIRYADSVEQRELKLAFTQRLIEKHGSSSSSCGSTRSISVDSGARPNVLRPSSQGSTRSSHSRSTSRSFPTLPTISSMFQTSPPTPPLPPWLYPPPPPPPILIPISLSQHHIQQQRDQQLHHAYESHLQRERHYLQSSPPQPYFQSPPVPVPILYPPPPHGFVLNPPLTPPPPPYDVYGFPIIGARPPYPY